MKRLLKGALYKVLGVRGASHLIFFLKYPIYYWKLRGYLDINGWLGYKEAVYLYEAARSIEQTEPTIVEIGTWQGKSAVVLGSGLNNRANAKVICIDPFDATGDSWSQPVYQNIKHSMNTPLKEACFQNLKKNGVEGVVELIAGFSNDVVRSWDKPIDLLFIDGDHRYEAVKNDFYSWTPFLVNGGLLVMDDVHPLGSVQEGPARVVRESIIDNPDWSVGTQVGTFYTTRKR